MKNILISYSRRNLTIGYCQGFNFIVGRILKIVENEVKSKFFLQEETFWIFCQIIEEILPLNYYNDLIGVMVDCNIVESLFQINETEFHDYIMKLGFSHNINNIINKWLISMFVNCIEDEVF